MEEDVFNIVREMVLEFIRSSYANKPDDISSKDDFNRHKELAKQLVDLTKALTNITQTQISMMGLGKSEEEMRQIMGNFMSDYLKGAIVVLEEHPEAKKKLVEYIKQNNPLKEASSISDLEGSDNVEVVT